MAKSHIEELEDISKRILDDIVAITSAKLRNVTQWHFGAFEDWNFHKDTVSDHSLFLTYKINDPDDCTIVYNKLRENINALADLNPEVGVFPQRPQYIVFWHRQGSNAEK